MSATVIRVLLAAVLCLWSVVDAQPATAIPAESSRLLSLTLTIDNTKWTNLFLVVPKPSTGSVDCASTTNHAYCGKTSGCGANDRTVSNASILPVTGDATKSTFSATWNLLQLGRGSWAICHRETPTSAYVAVGDVGTVQDDAIGVSPGDGVAYGTTSLPFPQAQSVTINLLTGKTSSVTSSTTEVYISSAADCSTNIAGGTIGTPIAETTETRVYTTKLVLASVTPNGYTVCLKTGAVIVPTVLTILIQSLVQAASPVVLPPRATESISINGNFFGGQVSLVAPSAACTSTDAFDLTKSGTLDVKTVDTSVITFDVSNGAGAYHLCYKSTNAGSIGTGISIYVLGALSTLYTNGQPSEGDFTNTGRIAVVANGVEGVWVIDYTTPTSPNVLAKYNTENSVKGAKYKDNVLVIADGGGGLTTIEVKDFTTPTSQWAVGTPYNPASSESNAESVALNGQYALLTDGWNGFHIVSFSVPATPTLVEKTSLKGYVQGVTTAGIYALIAAGDQGVHVVDWGTAPQQPTNITTLALQGFARGVSIVPATNILLVAAWDQGVRVLDITNLESGVLAESGHYIPSNCLVRTVTGYVYQSKNYALVGCKGTGRGVHVIDLADVTNPKATFYVNTPGDVYGIVVQGSYAVVNQRFTNGTGSIAMYQIDRVWWTGDSFAEIGNPNEVGLVTMTNAVGVVTKGNMTYVAAGPDGVHSVNHYNLKTVAIQKTYNTQNFVKSLGVVGIKPTGASTSTVDYLVAADANGGSSYLKYEGGAFTFLKKLSTNYTQGADFWYKNAAAGNTTTVAEIYAVLASGFGGLWLVNMQDQTIAGCMTNSSGMGYIEAVSVQGDYAYVAEGAGGLHIVDLPKLLAANNAASCNSPLAIVNVPTATVSRTPVYGYARSVNVVGTKAYVSAHLFGVRILDVTNPTSVTELGFIPVNGTVAKPGLAQACKVDATGRYAYVAEGDFGAAVWDVSNAAAPTFVWSYTAPSSILDVSPLSTQANVFVAADKTQGLRYVRVPTDTVSNLFGIDALSVTDKTLAASTVQSMGAGDSVAPDPSDPSWKTPAATDGGDSMTNSPYSETGPIVAAGVDLPPHAMIMLLCLLFLAFTA
eukprot:GFYU01001549.1.p1 GENE.GFYU01001549.1~~GFYU01001549.1.p1  ORF type:complete len:1103 (-),score=295.57 GFYU01001549.1:175-3483(-)